MRGRVLAVGALILSGCDRGTDPEPAPTPADPAPTAAVSPAPATGPAVVPSPPTGAPVLSPEGYGPLRVGMTAQEASQALGAPLEFDRAADAQPDRCRYGRSGRLPGVLVMFEQERLARIDLARGSSAKTDQGLGLGDRAEKVRAAYGPALHEDGHKYVAPPAAYLEAWNADRTRGVRYEIDQQGVVSAVYAGGQAVNYVEGCS